MNARLAFAVSLASLFAGSFAIGACTAHTIPIDLSNVGDGTNPTPTADGGSSGSTSSGSSGKPSSSGGTICEKICAKAESAKCSGQSTCITDCEADQKKIPAGCQTEADAAQKCAAEKATHFQCSSSGKATVKGDCDTEGSALVQCVLGGGKPDSGGPKDCGNLKTGDKTCDSCMEASCCSQLAACSGDKACLDIIDCASGCTDNACVTNCENAHSAGITKERALIGCMTTSCKTQCQ